MAALQRLPVRQRQVITLRVLLDLDTKGTARVLGISQPTVRAHLHRAIAAMRSQVAPLPGDGRLSGRSAGDLRPVGSPRSGLAGPHRRKPGPETMHRRRTVLAVAAFAIRANHHPSLPVASMPSTRRIRRRLRWSGNRRC